ncbi:MAG TPA: gluconeogenesis factor YvcK family protein, partial [Anaerolineales bacterium]
HEAWFRSIGRGIARLLRWFVPGIGVKRWFLVLLAGITLLGTGLAFYLLDVYRTAPKTWWLPILSFVSLRFLTRPWRIVIFASIGFGLTGLGIWKLNRALMVPFLRPGLRLVDQVTNFRRREHGPRIVAIGGGHGIATVLRGLKGYTNNLTAVVSVADDGGSSGELRRSLGILPPGDIRNCLAALSDDEALLTQLFQYRFGEDTGLGGHSFGNLFISALSDITGSFEKAIAESGRALSVHGQVLPATLHNVRLVADVQLQHAQTEVRVEGESKIPMAAGRVRRIWLEPDNPSAYPPVIQAVLAADMIIIGPGSLYTSILPNLLVGDLLEAIRSSRAMKLFISNLATEKGETDMYTCGDHIRSLEELVGSELVDLIVCNSWYDKKLEKGMQWVRVDETIEHDSRLYVSDLADHRQPEHHDAVKLAEVLMDLYNERTGPMVKE